MEVGRGKSPALVWSAGQTPSPLVLSCPVKAVGSKAIFLRKSQNPRVRTHTVSWIMVCLTVELTHLRSLLPPGPRDDHLRLSLGPGSTGSPPVPAAQPAPPPSSACNSCLPSTPPAWVQKPPGETRPPVHYRFLRNPRASRCPECGGGVRAVVPPTLYLHDAGRGHCLLLGLRELRPLLP